MTIQKRCVFILEADEPIISNSVYNPLSDTLVIEIQGDIGEYVIEGRIGEVGAWTPLAAINLTSLESSQGIIEKPGLYEIAIMGVRELRARVASTTGIVTIEGQLINSMEV